MRHSFACNALFSGQSVPYVQEMLGHSTPQMIYNRYGNSINTNSEAREGFEAINNQNKLQNKG